MECISGLQNIWKWNSNYYRICKASLCRRKNEYISITVDTDSTKTILVPIKSSESQLSNRTKIILVSEASPELPRYLLLWLRSDANFEIFCSPERFMHMNTQIQTSLLNAVFSICLFWFSDLGGLVHYQFWTNFGPILDQFWPILDQFWPILDQFWTYLDKFFSSEPARNEVGRRPKAGGQPKFRAAYIGTKWK